MVTRRRPRRRWCDTLVPPISPPIGRTRSSYSRSRLTARLPRRAELLSGPTPPPRQEGRTRIIGSTGPPSPGCGVGFDPLVGLDTPAMTLAKTVTVGGPPRPQGSPRILGTVAWCSGSCSSSSGSSMVRYLGATHQPAHWADEIALLSQSFNCETTETRGTTVRTHTPAAPAPEDRRRADTLPACSRHGPSAASGQWGGLTAPTWARRRQ